MFSIYLKSSVRVVPSVVKAYLTCRRSAGGTKTGENKTTKDKTNEDLPYPLVEGWEEKHASESETIIKAERHEHEGTIEELQKKSVKHFEKQVTKYDVPNLDQK